MRVSERDPDFQCDQSWPGDADVEAIVRLAAWNVGGIVLRSGLESNMPVLCGGDLRGVGLVAVDESTQELASLARYADGKQEMPHHRHSVAAKDEALNICEVEW